MTCRLSILNVNSQLNSSFQEISDLKQHNEQLLSELDAKTHETSQSSENLDETLHQKETELASCKQLCEEKTREIEQLTHTMTSEIEILQSRY